MLAQKLGLSLPSKKYVEWLPTDESSLVAWYQKGEGIAVDGSDNVERWNDGSGNGHTMLQATSSKRPAYSNGVLTFDPSTDDHLQTSSQISLGEEFTLAFRANPAATNVTILADNTTSNEFIKYSTSTRIVIKIDGTSKNLNLDKGSFGDDYIIISRDGSDVITLYHNGDAQSGTQTLAGECDIDAIGVRATDLNHYDGTVEEVQIYSSSSANLIASINARLQGI
jgi:hypothetical protein